MMTVPQNSAGWLPRGRLTIASAIACSILTCGCSSGPSDDPNPENNTISEAGPSGPNGGQGNQDPEVSTDEQTRILVETALAQARDAIGAGDYEQAQVFANRALNFAPTNPEARRLFDEALQLQGDDPVFGADSAQRAQVQAQADRLRAAQLEESAAADVELGNYDSALAKLQQALRLLRNNPLIADSAGEQALEAAIESTIQRRADAIASARQRGTAASDQDLADQERLAREQRQEQVDRLMFAANREFMLGRYGRSVDNLEAATRLSPNNPEVLALHELAKEALVDAQIEAARLNWRRQWVEAFQQIEDSLVEQQNPIEYDDLDYYRREVANRKPLSFSASGAEDDPNTVAILERLQIQLDHNFSSASIDDWKSYYANATQVNFIVDDSARDLDEEATTLTDFRLGRQSVAQALDTISLRSGLKWTIENGAVLLVSSDTPVGRILAQTYEVSDIVTGVADQPGPDLVLQTGEDIDALDFGPDEPEPTILEDGDLIDLITSNVEPSYWDEDDRASVSANKGVLIVRATKPVQDQVDDLLQDLRRSVGIQVDVEARFLTVSDSFLEDVGVDFRGLGDDASEGFPGAGLGDAPGLEFDDFGTSEQINTASPGRIGTGTEPGIFFNDGQDGQILTRTENLYDTTLGGGPGELDNAGGLALEYALLDDTEIEVILRAVQKEQRSEEIVSPRLLVYNNTRAHMQALRHTSYINDFEVEIAQAAAVANPSVAVVRDGVVLDVRPVVSADRRFITMELRPSILTLQLPIPTFTTTLGAGLPVSIQQPSVTLQRVRTTVTLPDGGTVLLGGTKVATRQTEISGVPVLKDIPLLSFFFSRKGPFVVNRRILILVRAQIILTEEFEPVLGIDPYEDLQLAGR
ncbi:MAG: hypothetical protein AAF196_04780 [Planctomycetota bacterium]